jgi:ribose transport system substrate-binding protein
MTEEKFGDASSLDALSRRGFIRRSAVAGATVMVFGVAGCGGDDSSGSSASGGGGGGGGGSKGKIAFGQPDRGAAVYPPLIAGAKEEAAKRGYEVVESFSAGSVDKQVAEINTWIAQKLKGIVVLPQDEKAIAPLAAKAKAAGIPFISYSSPVEGAAGIVTFDHKQGAKLVGEDVGKWINETLGGKAEVALLTFDEVETGRQRVRGAEEAMKAVAPGAKVVAEQKAILAPDALKVSQSMLQANPNINVFICIADDGCLGVRQAFSRTKRDPKTVYITGFDGAKPVMERILTGNDAIKSTAALDLKEIGRQAIAVPANAIEGKGETSYNAPYKLVTSETKDLARELIANYGA